MPRLGISFSSVQNFSRAADLSDLIATQQNIYKATSLSLSDHQSTMSSTRDIEKTASSDLSKNDVKREEYIVDEETYEKAEATPAGLSWLDRIASVMKAETRGIEMVPEEEKTETSIYEAASMWLSANMVIATFSLGALGITVFGLDFWTAFLTIFFFSALGCCGVAFFSIFGAKFGLRQIILSRFLVGDIAMRFFAFINCVACVGWGAVNIMASAQLLHIVNNGTLPPWGGCLILVILTIMVTFFGYKVIHAYEKWSWIPNLFVFLVIIARMKISGNFTYGTMVGGPTTAGNVLSFGGAIFGFATGWTTYAADYTVYMKRETSSYKIFFGVFAGLFTPLIFTFTLGAACATGTLTNTRWAELYASNSIGGLLYGILVEDSLHGFGQFCMVLLGLSTVSNNIPNMYSIALGAQSFWSPLAKVPRVFWTIAGNCITLAICIPGYYQFEHVMDNFMNMIGYYLAIYEAIAFSEHFIYRRGFSGYNVEDYQDKKKTPIGVAGGFAVCCGAAGVAIGICQVWYAGVVARRIGDFGGDIGFELAAAFAFVGYNAIRPFELKYFGR